MNARADRNVETVGIVPLIPRRQRQVLTGTAWILAAATAAGLALRLSIGPLHPAAIAVAAICFAICVAVSFLTRRRISPTRLGIALVAALTGLILSAAYAVGGLEGPVLAVTPVIPLVATFLVGRRAGWATTAALVAGIAAFALLPAAGHRFPPPTLGVEGTLWARALMVAIACVMTALLAGFYETQSQRLRDELQAESASDPLTGLANRRRLDEVLEQECRRAYRSGEDLSLILFDLDHFKSYNDSRGHPAGDRCLHRVAQAAAQRFRRTSDLVARFGGEEFAIVLPRTALQDALRLADELRAEIEEMAIAHPSSPLGTVTISAGLASAHDPDRLVPRDLVTRADRALYRAKRSGRNRTEAADEL